MYKRLRLQFFFISGVYMASTGRLEILFVPFGRGVNRPRHNITHVISATSYKQAKGNLRSLAAKARAAFATPSFA